MKNSLINTANTIDISESNLNSIEHGSIEFRLIPIDKMHPNLKQPRKFFDKHQLYDLAQSIKENGVLQPVLLRKIGDSYQIVSGERRFRACKLAGLKTIPAIIRNLNEEETLLAGLIENIQRQDLNPVEEARTLKEIILNHGLTHDQLAERIGRSRSALTNRLRLLQLPNDIQKMVATSKISAGHAKMLAGIKKPIEVRAWTRKILKDQLSVYELEKQLTQSKHSAENKNRKKKSLININVHLRAVEENLQEILGAKVRIRQGKKKGRIEIEFYNHDDLERVVESMVSMCL